MARARIRTDRLGEDQRGLLAIERRTLASLRREVTSASDRLRLDVASLPTRDAVKLRLLQNANVYATAISQGVTTAVMGARTEARKHAINVFVAQLGPLATSLGGRLEDVTFVPSDAAEDPLMASGAGDRISGAWKAGIALVALQWADGAGRSIDTAIRRVGDTIDSRLMTTAATEVHQAYNDEFEELGAQVAQQKDQTTWVPLIARKWNALLDRACPTCRPLDGTYALLGLGFRGGLEPGHVHPRCRCSSTLVVLPLPLKKGER